MADQQAENAPWYRINKNLLPLKIVYFTSYAAAASLIPYLSVYLKQYGLSSTETGIIYAAIPVVTLLTIVYGIIADKWNAHKVILAVCFVVSGGLFLLLLFIPQLKFTETSLKTELYCGPKGSHFAECYGNKSNATVSIINSALNTSKSISFECKLIKKPDTIAETFVNVCFVGGHTPDICKEVGISGQEYKYHDNTNGTANGYMETQINGQGESYSTLRNTTSTKMTAVEFSIHGDPVALNISDEFEPGCKRYKFDGNIHFVDQTYTHINCSSKTVFQCILSRGDLDHKLCVVSVDGIFKYKFWFFLGLLLFCYAFASPIPTLIDNLACQVIRDQPNAVSNENGTVETPNIWGNQRLWGTFGYAAFALSSTDMKNNSSSSTCVDFSRAFYIYLGLSILSAFAVYFINFNTKKKREQPFSASMCDLLKKRNTVVFLFLMVFFGMFKSVLEVFLFWHLKNLNANQIILGLCLVISSLSELVSFGLGNTCIKRCGYNACLCLALTSYAGRFLAYSFINNPWYVLFIEPFHCLTYALMSSAAMDYITDNTPPNMIATMQGLRGGFHSGLGKTLGGLATGFLFDSGIGEVWTFRIYAGVSFATCIIYATAQRICSNNDRGPAIDFEVDEPGEQIEEQLPLEGDVRE